ncbi:hypothetical protein L596_017935 [Steinernema carpocapsae]|uniref:Uncharacterized protein n=1 Tax=Steinernema carpocapsae TaxID=34508 RepID=A0A4U5N3J0_STECR|nr:hypothetical protein L596_017935 [Steinernema carpocapsae]
MDNLVRNIAQNSVGEGTAQLGVGPANVAEDFLVKRVGELGEDRSALLEERVAIVETLRQGGHGGEIRELNYLFDGLLCKTHKWKAMPAISNETGDDVLASFSLRILLFGINSPRLSALRNVWSKRSLTASTASASLPAQLVRSPLESSLISSVSGSCSSCGSLKQLYGVNSPPPQPRVSRNRNNKTSSRLSQTQTVQGVNSFISPIFALQSGRMSFQKESPAQGFKTPPSNSSDEKNVFGEDRKPSPSKTVTIESPDTFDTLKSISPSEKTQEKPDALVPDEAVSQKTVSEGRAGQENGPDSEELSDLSEGGDENADHTSKSLMATWYQRVHPLIRNKKVRYLAVVNFFLTIVNLLLLLLILGISGYVIYLRVHINIVQNENQSCVYEWQAWAPCSAQCYDGGTEKPFKTRKVNMSALVRARGSKPKCPEDLDKMVDKIECNTYRCAKRLSSFNYTNACYFNNPSLGFQAGCYRIRDIGEESLLLKIDTTNLTKPCKASECKKKYDNLQNIEYV